MTALVRHQNKGYYTDPTTGAKLRSVTTILGQGVPKESLIYWAGNYTAETALANLPYIVKHTRTSEGRADVYDWLRRAHTRKRDERSNLGTAVHSLIEAEVLGEPVPDEIRDDPDMQPYIRQFAAFVRDFQVTFVASEMVVANYRDGYAGTLDYLITSPLIVASINAHYKVNVPADATLMGDTKTGGELDVKGVYPEAGLQEAAYRKAEFCWLRDGSKVPMPAAAEYGIVLHLRPTGYRVVPVYCGDALFPVFLHAMEVAKFTSRISKTVLGAPLHPAGGHDVDSGGNCRHCSYNSDTSNPGYDQAVKGAA
jgi:hypothetical protein